MMKPQKTNQVFYLIFFLILLPFNQFKSSSAVYFIPTDLINGGGKEGTSASYKLYDSAGQPVIGDVSTSASFKHFTGFWYAVSESFPPPCDWIPDHFQFTAYTGWSYAILVDSAGLEPAWDAIVLKKCDEIGIFDGALCVGAAVYLDTFPIGITAWKDDPYTPSTDGYTDGDSISFKIWRADIDSEYTAYPDTEKIYSGDGNFGTTPYFGVGYVYTSSPEDELESLPESFSLQQNYPNPFNPITWIDFHIPKASEVKLEIYNILGERVRTLVNSKLSSGYKSVLWNGKNDQGQQVSSGVYLYQLKAGETVQAKKMVLLR